MLPLLVVLALVLIKDGYEDLKRHQSDRLINHAHTKTLAGGGWINPNITEGKGRSVSSYWRMFSNRWLGGMKRKNNKIAQASRSRASMSMSDGAVSDASSQRISLDAARPPVPGPGGILPPGPAANPRSSMATSRGSMSEGGHDSAYDVHDDGRIYHQGRQLASGEVAEYWSRRAPRWKSRSWEDIAVGDFIKLRNNEFIPADVLICATSEEEDTCSIETKNLDGETNLKSRQAVPQLTHLRDAEACTHADMQIDVEPQDVNLYKLNGYLTLNDRLDREGNRMRVPININQILLRGTALRNTQWVVGVVLMTGTDTKIIANSGNTPSKRGQVEQKMNPMVYFNLAVLAVMCVVCAIVDSCLEVYYFNRNAYWEFRAIYSDDNPHLNGLVTFGNGLITFQNIVPISLYISIEAVRLIQAYFIFDDIQMYYAPIHRRTNARSWNLSDDLGQIQYIFSDKTGTLTQNLMIFRQFSVAGVSYGQAPDSEFKEEKIEKEGMEVQDLGMGYVPKKSGSGSSSDAGVPLTPPSTAGDLPRAAVSSAPMFVDPKVTQALRKSGSPEALALGQFFRCMALCHTVSTETDEKGQMRYMASSPDEEALVQAASDVGFVFSGRDRNVLRLQTPEAEPDSVEEYELLTVLEFTSSRKRMSVIVKRVSDGQVLLLAKGADSIIFERCAPGQDALKDATDDALEDFANKGLRTLCLAYKPLDADAFDDWAYRYNEASVSLVNRDERMEDVASALERDLILLGASAIEDKLQDGVPETIADLKRAGIKVWVATGDKLETAIAIGYSTMLLAKDMNLIVVRGGARGEDNSAYDQLHSAATRFFPDDEVLRQILAEQDALPDPDGLQAPPMRARASMASQQPSMVGEDNGNRLGGYALVIDGSALAHALYEGQTRELLLHTATRCRAVICCRVSPLQKALVVRLVKEGLGAICLAIGDGANDVSMIQAAHVGVGIAGEEGLQAVNASDYSIAQFRYLKRLLLVHGHWDFYRNGTLIINFFAKNVLSIGILFWFQVHCGWSTAQGQDYVYILFWNSFWTVAGVIGMGLFDRNVSDRVLMEVPELYRQSREGYYFGFGTFLVYMLDSVYQSIVCYFFWAYTYKTTTAHSNGWDISLYEWSTGMAIASVMVSNLFLALDTRAVTWWMVFAVGIGPLLIWVFAPIYAAFHPKTMWTYSWGNNHLLYDSAYFWFCGVLTILLSLLPRFVWKVGKSVLAPTDVDICRYIHKLDPNHDFVHDPAMPGLRALQAYGAGISAPAGATPTGGVGAGDGVALALRPMSSRASSVHYDMLTGTARPNRGYSFSQEEVGGDQRTHRLGRRTAGSLATTTWGRRLRHPFNREKRRRMKRAVGGGGGEEQDDLYQLGEAEREDDADMDDADAGEAVVRRMEQEGHLVPPIPTQEVKQVDSNPITSPWKESP